MKALLLACVLASSLVTTLPEVAQAASIAYDGIQYPPPVLNLMGPSSGFAVPWAADVGVLVVLGGLASPLALPATGNAVAGCCDFQDPLSTSLAPLPGTEFWASFLLFHSGPNDQTFMGLAAAAVPFPSLPAVGFGVRLGQYGIFQGAAFTPSAVPFTPNGSTDFLVAHFTGSGGSWIVDLFVNTISFTVPALTVNVAPVVYGTMVNQNQSQFESDEFRLGTTAGDVAAGATPTMGNTWGRLKQIYR
jgi:hypothetical protein